MGAGWFVSHVTTLVVQPDTGASSSPSPSPAPSATGGPNIPVTLYPTIERTLDASDTYAGLTGLAIPVEGPDTFTVVPGVVQPTGTGPVRWVRVEVEDGLPISPDAVSIFVFGVLNDDRGWGANGRMTFAKTDGAADIVIVFASPHTVERVCPDPHAAVPPKIDESTVGGDLTGDESTATPSPSSSASPSAAPVVRSCAEQGIVVVNTYRWAAGLEEFGEARQDARQYLINHFLGHILEQEDVTCPGAGQLAPVMEDQEVDIAPCLPNSWPHPVPG